MHLAGPSELLCARVLPALAGLVAVGVRLQVAQGLTEALLEELRAGRHELVITTRRPRGRAPASVPLTDEEYVLVAGREWGERVGRHPAADDLCAALRDVPLVTYAEDLPIARRYWRTVSGADTNPDVTRVGEVLRGGRGWVGRAG